MVILFNRLGLVLFWLMVILPFMGPIGWQRVADDSQMVAGGLVVTDLNQTTLEEMASLLVGEGVAISNLSYTGSEMAAGRFSNGAESVGLAEGILLSTGDVQEVVGPNEQDGLSTAYYGEGDGDLTNLAGVFTWDAAVLRFDFVPAHPTIIFRYLFASDEYNEYANTQFNDAFAFFVNGENCAMIDELPVSVNSINAGNPQPGEDPTPHHPELYRNNDLDDGGGAINTELDGLTTVLTCTANVTPNAVNHLKLAIADASDPIIDSVVFLEANSLNSPPTDVSLTDVGTVGNGWLTVGRWWLVAGSGLLVVGWLWKKWKGQ